jgi:hypothetical protein
MERKLELEREEHATAKKELVELRRKLGLGTEAPAADSAASTPAPPVGQRWRLQSWLDPSGADTPQPPRGNSAVKPLVAPPPSSSRWLNYR